MSIPESGQHPTPTDLGAIFAEMEAAGCVGPDIADPYKCYRDALDAGIVKDPAAVANHVDNLMTACKNGGVGSCRELLKVGLKTDMGCLADKIHAWAPNIVCDCAEERCDEVVPLTWEQRRQLQIHTRVTAASKSERKVGNIPPWALYTGVALAAWLIFRRK